jgi:hypothetical protein
MTTYDSRGIKNLDDVKKEFPYAFDNTSLPNSKIVIKFINEELDDLIDTAHDNAIYAEQIPLADHKYAEMYKPIAEARGIYRYLWCREFVAGQMLSWGWNIKDLNILIKRMQQACYDPYSTTEYTAGEFIESLKGNGFKIIKTANGDEFRVYNPRGQ